MDFLCHFLGSNVHERRATHGKTWCNRHALTLRDGKWPVVRVILRSAATWPPIKTEKALHSVTTLSTFLFFNKAKKKIITFIFRPCDVYQLLHLPAAASPPTTTYVSVQPWQAAVLSTLCCKHIRLKKGKIPNIKKNSSKIIEVHYKSHRHHHGLNLGAP